MRSLLETYGLTYGQELRRHPEYAANSLVRMGRLELPRPCERWNLNPVRLPIPPHPLTDKKLLQVSISRQPPVLVEPVARVFRKLRNSCGFLVS